MTLKLFFTMMMMMMTMAMGNAVSAQRPISSNSQIPRELNVMFKLQQVKANILKALNMTSPPNSGMWFQENSKATMKTPRILETSDRQLNVSIILSESSGRRRQDAMSFRFDSRLRAQVEYMDTALLILFLHHTHSDGKVFAGRPRKSQLPHAPNDVSVSHLWRQSDDMNVSTNDSTDPLSSNKLSSRFDLQSNTTTHVSDNGIRRKGHTQQGGGRHQRTRALNTEVQVKVILKKVDQATGRKHKISEKQIIVKGSTPTTIPVPKDAIVAAATSSNHTLVLQVSCKRCKGHVDIEKVYKTFTKQNKKLGRRLNSNRPYLLIKMGSNSPSLDIVRAREVGGGNEIARKRSRRNVSQICSGLNGHSLVKSTLPGHVTCCSEIVYFSFEDLNLNFIIYPKGLSTVVCRGSCSGGITKWEGLDWSNLSGHPLQEHFNRFVQQYQAAEAQVVGRQVLDAGSVKESTTPGQRCVPSLSRPLSIVYLDRDNRATITKLDHVVHKSCQCLSVK